MAKTKILIPEGRLWPNTPSGSPLAVEVFGATGEYKSGKTLLGLSIAPGSHPEGHPYAGKPRTLYHDWEKSGGTYGGTGCERVDVPSRLLEIKRDNYKPIDAYEWFLDQVENKLKPRQYDVWVVDPITDIESGMVDYVKKNCEKFGLSKEQVNKAGGLLWGAVKDHWKQILLKLATKVQCFYFTSHLRQVWEGNTPVRGKKEPKGKETLFELASLYLWLEREPDSEGRVPAVPSAVVLKERLSDTVIEDGELRIIQLMPPRLPVATVAAIREYIANPPNYAKLKPDERIIEKPMSDEERLQLQLQISENERATEENRVSRLARQLELQQLAQAAANNRPQNSDQTAALQAQQEAKRLAKAKADDELAAKLKAEADASLAKANDDGARLMRDNDGANPLAGQEQIDLAKSLFQQAGVSAESFQARCGGRQFKLLTATKAGEVIRWMQKVASAAAYGEQVREAKRLTKDAYDRVIREKILATVGAKAVCDLDDQNLDTLVESLLGELERMGIAPIPF